MSNSLAIATVTKALAQIVQGGVAKVVPGADVKTERPDQTQSGARVNLFLYQVTPNATLRNAGLPTRDADGRVTMRPNTALNLHYLLSFYGDEKKFEPQRMLGGAVCGLLSEPVLSRTRISNASHDQNGDHLDQSNLVDAFEQVKITLLPLTLEELSKIWSLFYQIPYALSIAYLATVVVIETDDSAQTILPVLKRGEKDQGVETNLGPFPGLDSIHIGEGNDDDARLRQPSYPSATLNTILTLRGHNLGGDSLSVRFAHPHLPPGDQIPDIPVTPIPGRNDEIKLLIPNPNADESTWAAGIYSVTVIQTTGGKQRGTNSLPLPLAPQIQSMTVGPRDAEQNVEVTVTALPEVWPTQQAVLVLPDREITCEPRANRSDLLKFQVNDPASGQAVVRLRVDGVETLQFKRDPGPPPASTMDTRSVNFP